MLRKLFLLTITLAITLMACNPQTARTSPGPLTTIRLPMGYIPNVQYAQF